MSDGDDRRLDATRTKWGIAVFQIIFGGMVIWFTRNDGLTLGNAIACFALIAVGLGLIFEVTVARWLALGICFLYVMLALVLPLLMFLARPPGIEDRAQMTNVIFTLVAFAFGGIGYRGLAYYRSDLGRFEYRRDKTSVDVPPPDGSVQVVYSAGVWLGFLALLCLAGLSLPTWLVKPLAADGTFRMAEPPAPRPSPEPERAQPPDIVVRGLCRMGDSLVFLAYEYEGRPTHATHFTVAWNDSAYDKNHRTSRLAKLPEPGETGTVLLGSREALVGDEHMAAQLEIDIDPEHQVLSDTGHASYSLGAWLVPNLPECRTMRARTR